MYLTNDKKRDGQAMLLAVLALGGAILGATTVAGLLMLYQIRNTTDSQHSAAAIFAADTGVEWALFDYFCEATSAANPVSRCLSDPPREQVLSGTPPGTLGNKATLEIVCYTATGATSTCSTTSTVVSAVSKGTSLNTKRAFLLNFIGASSTLP